MGGPIAAAVVAADGAGVGFRLWQSSTSCCSPGEGEELTGEGRDAGLKTRDAWAEEVRTF